MYETQLDIYIYGYMLKYILFQIFLIKIIFILGTNRYDLNIDLKHFFY